QGNYIGTDPTGGNKIANGSNGINVSVPNVTIGCDDPPGSPVPRPGNGTARNVISGNGNGGVNTSFATANTNTVVSMATGLVVGGNYIGTAVSGPPARGTHTAA